MFNSYNLRWFLSLVLINLIALWLAYGFVLAIFPNPIPEEYRRELGPPIRIRLATNEIRAYEVATIEGNVFAPDVPLANAIMKVDMVSPEGKTTLIGITRTDIKGRFSILINPLSPGQYLLNFTIIDPVLQRQTYATVSLKVSG